MIGFWFGATAVGSHGWGLLGRFYGAFPSAAQSLRSLDGSSVSVAPALQGYRYGLSSGIRIFEGAGIS